MSLLAPFMTKIVKKRRREIHDPKLSSYKFTGGFGGLLGTDHRIPILKSHPRN